MKLKTCLFTAALITAGFAMPQTLLASSVNSQCKTVPHINVGTELSNRVSAKLPNQPGPQGKTIVSSKSFKCFAGSGTCTPIYQEVTSVNDYCYTTQGNWPGNIEFTVQSAGGAHGNTSTHGKFTLDIGGQSSLTKAGTITITGDSNPITGCVKATPEPNAVGMLAFCPGDR